MKEWANVHFSVRYSLKTNKAMPVYHCQLSITD